VADLSTRLGVSKTTLLRLERGDPGAGAGAYLTALLALGIADRAVPALPAELWQGDFGQRVKLSQQEKGGADAEYF
jgi:transcriptional regulator with XRE-family HTH domain